MEAVESAGAAALQAPDPDTEARAQRITLPPSPERTHARPVPERVGLPEVLGAAAGLLALGTTVAVGTGGGDIGRVSPSVVLGTVGALALTAPAMVVGHQYLRVDSPVSAVVDRIASGLAASGRLAWGIVPIALFFAATAPASWPVVFGVLGSAVGGVLLGVAALGLHRLAPRLPAWNLTVLAWVIVTVAIGLRLVATLLGG